jgi:catechol 2,3-dioxygenase-like lactoylglutathione lyase family enzyme
MAIQLNHTIVHATDKTASATFLAEMLGCGAPKPMFSFLGVEVDNGVTLDFLETDEAFDRQHYAFLVDDDAFDAIFGRIKERGLQYYADPGRQQAGEINTRFGGRGVYWEDPDGHLLEILTKPYVNEA